MSRFMCFGAATAASIFTCSLAAVLPAASATAANDGFERDQRANISLSSFSVSPRELHLRSGQPVLLRVANDSSVSHDLTAPEFFSAAAVRGDSASSIVRGRISLAAHQNVIVRLVPAAGRYSVKCSHPLHKMLGMSGTIIVDP